MSCLDERLGIEHYFDMGQEKLNIKKENKERETLRKEAEDFVEELKEKEFGVLGKGGYKVYIEDNYFIVEEEKDKEKKRHVLTLVPSLDIEGLGNVEFRELAEAMCAYPELSLKEGVEKLRTEKKKKK